MGGGGHGSSVVTSGPNGLLLVFHWAPFLCQCWVHFGLHLGVILGADFAILLLFAARFTRRPSNEVVFFQDVFLVDLRVGPGMGGQAAVPRSRPVYGGVVKPHLAPEAGGNPTRSHIFRI